MHRLGDYDALEGVNWSTLKEMLVSAKRYFWKTTAEQEEEDKEALRIGLGVHAFVLEPEKFRERFVTYRESKSVGAGARKNWEAFKEANKERTILSVAEYDRILGAASAILERPHALKYFTGGDKEMAFQWADVETNILCKGRCDQWLKHVVELKTTRNIVPAKFRQDAARLGYVPQMAWYRDGLRTKGLELADDGVMVTVENIQPHDVVVYRVSAELLAVGRDIYRELLARLRRCIQENRWPGVAEDEIDLEMPEWWFPKDDLELVMPDGEALTL
jgi:hypothetical protein